MKSMARVLWLVSLAAMLGAASGQQVEELNSTPDPNLNANPQVPPQSLHPNQLEQQVQQVQAQPVVREKVCIPTLNISALLSGPSKGQPKDKLALALNGSQTHEDAPTRSPILSFPIEDINMKIAQTGGSVHSALKMLSSFSSQLARMGDDEDEQEDEEDEDVGEENLVKFKSNRLTVEGLNLSMLNIHLYPDSDPRFGLGITVKNTTLTGKFTYNGPAILTETKLAAYYRMSIDNIYLTAYSNLTKRLASGFSETDENRQFLMRTENFNMNVSNIGYITIEILDSKDSTKPTVNYLLRMLQRILQKTIKRTYYSFENYIRQTLEIESRRSIDCELTRFSPLLSGNDSMSSNQLEDLARIINNEIRNSHFGSVPLPDYDHHQSILGTQAKIHLHNGSLSGLDHLQLNGETKIKLQDQHLLVNASIGWFGLRPYYNWDMYLGANASAPTAKGFVAFNIKQIDFDAVITKGLRPRTRIVVDQLEIRQLDSPKMDIGGLPGMNRLTRGIVNFFMGRLKQRLSGSLQPVLKNQLEKSLNKMSIFG